MSNHEPPADSLDRYHANSPPSLTDELRGVIQQCAELKALRLCRRGKLVTRQDGSSFRPACRNKWSCPTCSPFWLGECRRSITQVLRSVPTVVFVTFTLAQAGHGAPPVWSLDSILETWSAAFSRGSWMSDFRDRSELLGWVRTIEVTFQEEGSHPHIHAAFLFASQRHGDHLEALTQRWLVSAERQGLRASYKAQKGSYVARGRSREKVASYLCKQSAIRQSRGGKGRTPGDLLHNVASTGDADDLQALRGFHRAVAGKQKISTSRGFWSLAEQDGVRDNA
jgi:hypothetical protein